MSDAEIFEKYEVGQSVEHLTEMYYEAEKNRRA